PRVATAQTTDSLPQVTGSAVTGPSGDGGPSEALAPGGPRRGPTQQSTATTAGRSTTPSPPAAAAPIPAVRGPLRSVDNRVVDADGHQVVLRGIQRVGFQIPGKWPAISDAEMAHARAWGANVIRLPLAEVPLDPRCSDEYLPSYLDTLDSAVKSITSLGMVAVLDLSFVTRTPCGESFRWRMADKASIGFWRIVADRYKANPLVAFDLFNEPHDINDDQWRNGGQLTDWTATGPVQWTAAGMQQLYEAVRSTGATNVVMIAGNGYGGSPDPIL